MQLKWSQIEKGMLWSSARSHDNGLIRLVVEALPRGKWDWIVWHTGRRHEPLYGVSKTAAAAIATAEEAAIALAQGAMAEAAD